MDLSKLNFTVYSGSLAEYHYPANKEFGNVLQFLKKVDKKKDVHLTDAMFWRMPYPQLGFKTYLVFAMGEFVNEDFIQRMENDPAFASKELILVTSQYYQPNNLKRFKVFHLEHMHAMVNFYDNKEYIKLANRTHTHASLSRRNALHKSFVINRLLKRFPDLQYTLCNVKTNEFEINNFAQKNDVKLLDGSKGILGIDLSDSELRDLMKLHRFPRQVPGEQWDIDNYLYTGCKLMWVTESIFLTRENHPTAYLTEKTIKPIASGNCFVLVSQANSYRRLASWGFLTFEDIFKIDFDTKVDSERLTSIYQLIDNFDFDDVLNTAQVQEMVDYNHRYFFNNFFNKVEKDNEPKIETILEYINER